MDGYNRIHAILGASDTCIATHPSDMAVALVALDASVHIRAANGERVVPIMEFHLLPGDTPDRETVIRPGELITYVTLPSGPFGPRSAYVKLRDRASYEFALASAALVISVAGGQITRARVALGGVGAKPWRTKEIEAALAKGPRRGPKLAEDEAVVEDEAA